MMTLSNKFFKILTIVNLMVLFLLAQLSCNSSATESTSDIDREPTLTPAAILLSTPTPPPTPDWTPELKQLKIRLLGGGCVNPCWFGIEPNVTPADEVPNILKQLIEQGIISDSYLVRHPVSTAYNLSFAAAGGRTAEGGLFAGSISINEDLNLVTRLGLGSYGLKFITLGDIIEQYGSPKLVADGAGDSFNGVYLAYPEKEIFLWARADSFAEEAISPDMAVITLSFLSPYSPNHPIQSPDIDWIEWEGYQTFTYYYLKFPSE